MCRFQELRLQSTKALHSFLHLRSLFISRNRALPTHHGQEVSMSRKSDKERATRNPELDVRLAGDPNAAYCKRLAEEAAKAGRHRNLDRLQGRVSRLQDASSAANLERDAKLQWDAVIETGYSPSKWLVEQELKARMRWDPEARQFLDEPCFPHGEGEPLFKPAKHKTSPGTSPEAGLNTSPETSHDTSHETSHDTRDVYEIAAEQELTGVCFSGGGIRSATFNLGILQGLAELGLLPFIDYLSSVSGGGYIHQFLAAWILHDREGRVGVERELIPRPEPGCPARPPEPIRWLQRYASYLTPKRGLLSTDTWTMIAIWFRNMVLNQVPIVAFLWAGFALMNLLVQMPVSSRVKFHQLDRVGEWGAFITGALLLAGALCSVVALARDLHLQEKLSLPSLGTEEQKKIHDKLLNNDWVRGLIIFPWIAMAIWASYWPKLLFWQRPAWHVAAPRIGCAAVLAAALVAAFAGGAWRAYDDLHDGAHWWNRVFAWLGFVAVGSLSTAVACGLGYVFQVGSGRVASLISSHAGNLGTAASQIFIDPWRVQVVILPGLLLSVPYVAIEVTLGLLGRDFADSRREWLARLRAWSLLYAAIWIGLTAIALLGPYLVYFALSRVIRVGIPAALVFVISHLTVLWAGSSSKSDGKPTGKGLFGYKPTDVLAIAAAPIAVLSFLTVLSFGVEWTANFLVESPHLDGLRQVVLSDLESRHRFLESLVLVKYHLTRYEHGLPVKVEVIKFAWKFVLLTGTAFFVAVALLFGWRLDINEFSMQSFYRNRLSRCYLGATLWERMPNPFTGFDMRSRVEVFNERGRGMPPLVKDLLPDRFNQLGQPGGQYDGPFPIFGTTLNLTTGEDLASQERKGASFAFTPLYSGYSVSWTDARKNEKVSLNGYVPTQRYAYRDGGIHLDTAAAISGAAVNPNQGYNSNPALAFLMTFFNVRLGWWISNPRKTDAWDGEKNRSTPTFALWYLLRELFGSANDKSKYVNLSDGGHFENMGLYELVRRRCKFIIVCDAEEDPHMKFCGIGNAVNRCRADFGTEIDLDLRPLQIQSDGFSQAHCVVGTIRYPPPKQQDAADTAAANVCKCLGEQDPDVYKGIILYMKSSLVGDEPADLLAYRLQHDTFPQDSTANQWFTETQFESYRRLGHHIAMTAIRPALRPPRRPAQGQPREPVPHKVTERPEIADLFRSMYSIWYPPTPEMQQYLSQHVEQYHEIMSELRQKQELTGLAATLNDGRNSLPGPLQWNAPDNPEGSKDYAWQFANALLDFMYTVYTDLELAFPDNRVSPHADWWVCLFRRWCRVSLLQETWQRMEQIYPEEFRLFARRELMLP
jgi:hypothetical protein